MAASPFGAELRLVAGCLAVAIAWAVAACGHPAGSGGSTARTTTTEAALPGDATRGRALVDQFECVRCHTVANVAEMPKDKQCAGCHHDINAGSGSAAGATPEQKARWQPKVAELGDVPSLVSTGGRLRRAWIQGFLLHPHALRPGLQPTMPRLPLTPQQAADLATYLSPNDDAQVDDLVPALGHADAARGRELLDVKGCALCHRMSGVAPLHVGLLPAGVSPRDMTTAARLAPDLRFTRERWRASTLVRWLVDPAQVKPDALMPNMGLGADEAKAVAAYLLTTTLAPEEHKPVPARLPVLPRRVTYDEVATRVLRKTCWHCHGEPDFERGDGGPGNSGGFGFKGRGLNLSDYAATFAGFLDDGGRRTSVFAASPDGTPHLVAVMLARQREEAGEEPAIRGMPLGLPAVSPEDVQLVETWIAQGKPR
ncbi:MAG: cytochrome c [Polyangiaceae bacterium]